VIKILFRVIFIVFCVVHANAQDSSLSVKEIQFLGLQKTKSSYLNDIISTEANDIFKEEKLSEDIQRLKNLAGVMNAYYTLDTLDNEVYIAVNVEERKTALPIINFGGIRGNIWLAVGVTENNFRGKGDVALAFYQNNNGRHAGQIYFRKPEIRNTQWGYSFGLNSWASNEPLFFNEGTVHYLYDNNAVSATGIKRFGFHRELEFGGTYFVEKYSQAEGQELENPPGPTEFTVNKLLTKVLLKQDFINYNTFYLEGHDMILNYQNVYNLDDFNWFNSLTFQTRYFAKPRPKINLALRLKLAVSTNDDSPFAPFVADSHINIRGIGNRIDRGTAQAILNLEFRRTIVEKKAWGGQFVAFIDSGTWRNPGGRLNELWERAQFRQFIGGGIRLNYQKIFGATFRLDYGIDVFNPEQKGLVIGLGQYF